MLHIVHIVHIVHMYECCFAGFELPEDDMEDGLPHTLQENVNDNT
jgi:hypothetical protein